MFGQDVPTGLGQMAGHGHSGLAVVAAAPDLGVMLSGMMVFVLSRVPDRTVCCFDESPFQIVVAVLRC
ncbi:MAG: hypothetical protein NTW74_19890 [Acidobacteria bacterium]|nr:hypothetical protein [Acidobacteriota bacterium]